MSSVKSTTEIPITLKRKLDETDILNEEHETQPPVPKEKSQDIWFPPSVHTIDDPFIFVTSTYASEVPESILDNKSEPIVLGVDEAGRGPVLGPMVYGVAYALESFLSSLQREFGFADSKILSEPKREELFQQIEDSLAHDNRLNKYVGWATTTITAKDISSGMLQSSGKGAYNLNSRPMILQST